jgi:intracellular sulfur oxidation DsrE/DsrF family protein
MAGFTGVILLFAALGLVCNGSAMAAEPANNAAQATANQRHKLVVQVTDDDQAKWNLALNNVKNVQSELGAANVEIEIVAYGPGISMIRLESPVSERVRDAITSGVKVIACKTTMAAQKITEDDMLPALGYVPAGAVEIMMRQLQGYAYIRP